MPGLSVVQGLYNSEINFEIRPYREGFLFSIGAGQDWEDSAEFDRIEDGIAWLRQRAGELFPNANVEDQIKTAEQMDNSPVGLEILEQFGQENIWATLRSDWDGGYEIGLAGPEH